MKQPGKTILFLALAAALLLSGCAGGGTPDPVETFAPPTEAAAPAETPEPVLLTHIAFLFPDPEGFLEPDAALTEEALEQALEALQPSAEAEAKLRALAGGTRRDFARAVAALAGWTAEERLSLYAGAAAPVDLDPGDGDFALLLEASVPHREDASGKPWARTPLQTGHSSGPFLRGSALCACGEDGFLLREASLGPLYFGPDGRFTSGDAELDAMTGEIIAALQEQYPEDAADRLALLRHCYDWVYESFSYLGRKHSEEEGVDWSAEEAKLIFETGKGNCYHYSAAFKALARRLGFPAYTVMRSLDGNPENVHAWTDIVIDGVPYVFDPQLHQRYGQERYMLSYEQARQYGNYQRPEQEVIEAENP